MDGAGGKGQGNYGGNYGALWPVRESQTFGPGLYLSFAGQKKNHDSPI